jgi:uncharacterized protein
MSVEIIMGKERSQAKNRIEMLDVLRGFALLGILLMNILGFGMVYHAYANPGFDLTSALSLNKVVWVGMELTVEGAMRALFSILFGAGVLLFTTGDSAKSAGIHYRRMFWLLLFGLFDAFILLWSGDILITYAIAGCLLFLIKRWSPRALLICTGILLLITSLFHGATNMGLAKTQIAYEQVEAAANTETLPAKVRNDAMIWEEVLADVAPDQTAINDEIAQRGGSYASAFAWNAEKMQEILLYGVPFFLIWDVLIMMLLGMYLFRIGVLQGDRSPAFYKRLALVGFALGLAINAYEISAAHTSQFSLLSTLPQMQITYHWGRLGMALGYIGLFGWLCHSDLGTALKTALAAVGRMALSNYLLQSAICLILFTGLGFGLVGTLQRATLYVIVALIWLAQIIFSLWWLARFRFGPAEWLWRYLTYGKAPVMRVD